MLNYFTERLNWLGASVFLAGLIFAFGKLVKGVSLLSRQVGQHVNDSTIHVDAGSKELLLRFGVELSKHREDMLLHTNAQRDEEWRESIKYTLNTLMEKEDGLFQQQAETRADVRFLTKRIEAMAERLDQ